MERIQIISSGQYRPLLNKVSLPKDISIAKIYHQYTDGFFVYRGTLYNINKFTKIKTSSSHFLDWDGIFKEQEYYGILVKYSSDKKSVKVANYILPFIQGSI